MTNIVVHLISQFEIFIEIKSFLLALIDCRKGNLQNLTGAVVESFVGSDLIDISFYKKTGFLKYVGQF